VQDLCEIRVDTFIVTETQELEIDLGNDTVICENQSLVLDAGTYAGARYRWQDGSSRKTLNVARSGTYHVQVTDGRCIAADTVVIRWAEVAQQLGPDISVCREDMWVQELHATIEGSDAEVRWSTGERSSSITVRDSGVYWVVVADGQCIGSDTVRIIEEMCVCAWMIPDAFTPNGDGRNDLFRVVFQSGCPVNDYQMRVYDRWGKMVYTTTDPRGGWDGSVRGMAAGAGVYMYEVSFAGGTNRKAQFQKGDITLIR